MSVLNSITHIMGLAAILVQIVIGLYLIFINTSMATKKEMLVSSIGLIFIVLADIILITFILMKI